MNLPKMIYTGSKFFGKKIYIESFGDKELDAALKSTFHDNYHRTATLRMARRDVSLLIGEGLMLEDRKIRAKQGQLPLFGDK